jgi:hypothetical protein
MQFWKELEGKSLAGRYTLGALLRSLDQAAWFAAKDDQQKPWVAFVAESANDDDQRLKNLEAASRVKQANVVSIEKTGRTRIGDTPVVYAIQEVTEENLGEVLRERALTAEETAQITQSLVAGLTAIHEQGLSHSQVNPANIWASGDTVKLTSDCLQRVSPETRGDAFAQDTGDLGATVFEALTQRKLTSPDDPAIEKLPVPFKSIVHSSVIGRWGLGEIAIALKKPALDEFRHPVPAAETAAKPKFAENVAPKTAVAARPKPPVPAPPVTTSRKNSMLLFAALALIAALGVAWFFYHSFTASQPGTSTATQEAAPAPAAAPAAAPSTPPAPSPTTGRPPVEAAVPVSADHKIWRVVVYTFTNQSAAEHKAKAIREAHPDFKPEVFSASGHSPWLVTVGGPMDHDQAIQLRDKVRDSGMPRDSYAQNYSH